MSMKFDEEVSYTQNRPMGPQPSGMAKKLIKMGLAKDAKQANYVLFGLLGVLAIITFIAMSSLSGPASNSDSSIDQASIDAEAGL